MFRVEFCKSISMKFFSDANEINWCDGKSNFDDFSDKRIMGIQKKINRRPREKLNIDSPIMRFPLNVA